LSKDIKRISLAMSKLLVVFGATGQQGGSVVSHVLNDAELSKQYKVRAVTRDPSSSKAEALKTKGVEVVKADLSDPASLSSALKGAHTIFFLTSPSMGPNAKSDELGQGKGVADAAVAAGVQYIIFSTLPHVERLSGGKYTKVMKEKGTRTHIQIDRLGTVGRKLCIRGLSRERKLSRVQKVEYIGSSLVPVPQAVISSAPLYQLSGVKGKRKKEKKEGK
jgi:hypothetical protein